MSKVVWVGILAGVGGILVGLQIAKSYAKSEVSSTTHDFLDAIGLGGGKVESVVDKVVLPLIVS